MTKTLVATPDPEPKPKPTMTVVTATTGTTMTFPATWTLGQVSTFVKLSPPP